MCKEKGTRNKQPGTKEQEHKFDKVLNFKIFMNILNLMNISYEFYEFYEFFEFYE